MESFQENTLYFACVVDIWVTTYSKIVRATNIANNLK